MTTKKSKPVSRSQISEACSRNQGSRPVPSSQKMKTHGYCQGYAQRDQVSSDQSSIMINSNQRACDTARISQWAASSATGPNYPTYGPNCTTYGSDMSLTSVAPPASGAYPVPYSDDFQFSSYAIPLEQAYVPDLSYDESSAYNAGAQFSRMNISQEVGQGQSLNLSTCYDGQDPSTEIQSYGLPAGNGFTMESHPPMTICNTTNGYDSHTGWGVQAMQDVCGSNTMVNSQPSDWTSSMTMTPSTSSLPSEHSYLSHQPDTPVSAIMLDGMWPIANGSLDGDLGMVPPFTIGEAAQVQSAGYYEDQRLAFFSMPACIPNPRHSTIRPNQSHARGALNMDLFSTQDSQAFGVPQYPVMDGSRRGSDGENRNARDHPFYKVEARKDGLYHCPFATTDDCTHKPEKLKCNYE